MQRFQFGRKILVKVAGLEIDNLRIKFVFKNQADTTEQDSKIQIYNLSYDKFKALKDIHETGKHIEVEVFAGYTEGAGLILAGRGSLAFLRRDRDDASIVTELIMGDRVMDAGVSGGWVRKNWKGVVPVRTIVQDVATEMGMKIRNLDVIPPHLTMENYQDNRPASSVMSDLLYQLKQHPSLEHEIYWILDQNDINVVESSLPSQDAKSILKTPSNGMIGVPKLEEDGRLTVEMLLDTKIRLRDKVVIHDSDYVDGNIVYTIDAYTHDADNWDGKFLTKMELIPPNYVAKSSRVRRLSADTHSRSGGKSARPLD